MNYETNESNVGNLPSQVFIDLLVKEIRAGRGIIPYTGAGVSARSGLMVGADFVEYLTWVIYLCVRGTKNNAIDIHNMRSDGWPARPTATQVDTMNRLWVKKIFKKICRDKHRLTIKEENQRLEIDEHGSPRPDELNDPAHPNWLRPLTPRILTAGTKLAENDEKIRCFLRTVKDADPYFSAPFYPNESPYSQESVEETAIRSLHDWRAMLNFLARIQVRRVGDEPGKPHPVLGEHDASVIDSFNQYITRGHKPNLTHSMLAHLAAPMRTRILFTTNFDSLHEEAFHNLGMHPERLSVSVGQGLQSVETIRAKNCIVKLHGSFTGTRADFSLDEVPGQKELERFFQCVTGHRPGERQASDRDSRWIPSHLLVIGNALQDARCVQFIKHLLEFDDQTKIFLVGFNGNDLLNYRKLFAGHCADNPDNPDNPGSRVHITLSDRSDLLLLELYQALTLTLPKGGFNFHYSHDVPPHLWRESNDHSNTRPLAPAAEISVKRIIACVTASSINPPAGKQNPGCLAVLTPCQGWLPKSVTPTSKKLAMAAGTPANPGLSDIDRDRLKSLINDYSNSKEFTDIINLDDLKRADGCELVNLAIMLKTQLMVSKNARNPFAEDKASVRQLEEDLRREFLSANVILSEENTIITGIGCLVREVFRRLNNSHRKQTIWLEMEDYTDVMALAHRIFQVIALRRGLFQLENAVLIPGGLVEARAGILNNFKNDRRNPAMRNELRKIWDEVMSTTGKYLGKNLNEYVICLYGRNVPGSCAGWKCKLWEEADYAELHVVLELLSHHGLNLLYAPLDIQRMKNFNSKLDEVREKTASPEAEKLSEIGKPKSDFNVKSRNCDVDYLTLAGVKPLVVSPDNIREQPGNLQQTGVVERVRSAIRSILPPSAAEKTGHLLTLLKCKQKFLFATSLFRMARPPSVFLTTPVFASSLNHHHACLDNDWLRHQISRTWLVGLKKEGLIWRKPGGNSWMYLDGLWGLRWQLDRQPQLDWFHTPQKENQNDRVQFMRARYHAGIAQWYFRAFCSTNHGIPLLEAMYHSYHCIKFIDVAEPESSSQVSPDNILDCQDYRGQLFVRALGEWVKIVKIGRPALEFWFDRVAVEGWFGEKVLTKILREVEAKIALLSKPYRWRSEALFKKLKCELNACRDNYLDQPSFPPVLLTEPDPGTQLKAETMGITVFLEKFESGLLQNQKLDRPLKELGEKIIGLLGHITLEPPGFDSCLVELQKWVLKTNNAGYVAGAASLLKELCYAYFRRAKLLEFDYVLNNQKFPLIPSAPAARKCWLSVSVLAKLTVTACRFCSPDLLEFEMNIRIVALGYQAIAMARLGRFFQAHRQLNEAHALLLQLSRKGDQPAFAVLELRRAEVRVLEAEQVALLLRAATPPGKQGKGGGKTDTFPHFNDDPFDQTVLKLVFAENKSTGAMKLENLIDQPGSAPQIFAWQLADLYFPGEPPATTMNPIAVQKQLQQIHLRQLLVSKLDDAWNSIEFAESLLSGHSRTSLWWARLCSLKLRFFASHTRASVGSWQLLAERRKQDLGGEFLRWLRLGFANVGDNRFRKTRLAWYYLHAKANWMKFPHDDRDTVMLLAPDDEDTQLLASTLQVKISPQKTKQEYFVKKCARQLSVLVGRIYFVKKVRMSEDFKANEGLNWKNFKTNLAKRGEPSKKLPRKSVMAKKAKARRGSKTTKT